MSEWGGADAQSLKKAIDNIFENRSNIPIEDYQLKLISLTTDGASVNTGKTSGLMTRMEVEDERHWLIKIHCINHRVELAAKKAFLESPFKEIDRFCLNNYYLLRDSGKIKSEVKKSAEVLGIQNYNLPKMTGTRFIGHRRKAFEILLKMWPAFLTAYENVVADPKTKPETRAKVQGLLNSFWSYKTLSLVCTYLDILEKTVPASKVFEGEKLLPFEIRESINRTMTDLEEYADDDCDNLDSHLHRFAIVGNEENDNLSLVVKFDSPGDQKKKLENRKPVHIDFKDWSMTFLNEDSQKMAISTRNKVAETLIELLRERFQSFDDPVFLKMSWCNPEYWADEKDFGIDELEQFSSHFKEPLAAAKFDFKKAIKEWKHVQRHIKQNLCGKPPLNIWKSIIQYKLSEFPNICLLVEIVFSLSGSNSSVEQAFSILTMMLTDRRLNSSHELLEMRMLIKVNDKNWNETERKEIIKRAFEIYISRRRRKRKLDDESSHIVINADSSDEINASSDSDDCHTEFENSTDLDVTDSDSFDD